MTRAVTTLVVVFAITYSVRSFTPPGAESLSPGVTLSAGFLLIAAIQAGRIFDRVRLPHLTGFIIAGLICGPEVLGVITGRALNSLALIKGVSVGLIALLAGCELNFKRLRPRMREIGAYTIATLLITFALLFALFFAITGRLSATAGMSATERATIALLCANVLCAFSPPVVIAIISEARASGKLSELWISIAVINNLLIVVSFSLTNSISRGVFPGEESTAQLTVLLTNIFGSIAAGTALGLLFAWYARAVASRVGLFVFLLLFVVAEAGTAIDLNPLLVGLTAGLFLENVSPIGGRTIIEAAAPVAMPVYAIFFAVIGAEVHLHAFLSVASFAIFAALTRAAGIYAGTLLSTAFVRGSSRERHLLPFGMLPQAGIAMAVATIVISSLQPWGTVVGPLLIGTIVVNELFGPVLMRIAVARSGEAATS